MNIALKPVRPLVSCSKGNHAISHKDRSLKNKMMKRVSQKGLRNNTGWHDHPPLFFRLPPNASCPSEPLY